MRMEFRQFFPLLCLAVAILVFQATVVVPAGTGRAGSSNSTNSTNSSTTCSKTPTLATEQTWVSNPNCTNGTTYNTNNGTTHCHCWSHCGYICAPRNASTNSTSTTTTTAKTPTNTTTTTTTPASTCKRQPTLQTGESFVNNSGCKNGTTYDPTPSTRCHCWSFCGYICGSKPFSTTTAATNSTG